MDFKIPAHKKAEFQSVIEKFGISFANIAYDHDGENVIAHIQYHVVDKLTKEQLGELRAFEQKRERN